MENRNLPTIQELYDTEELVILQKENKLNVLLNQEPKESWIKEHPILRREVTDGQGVKRKVPLKYLPIQRIEWLLTCIFISWRVEVLETQQIGNSVVVTVRLHYLSVVTGEWTYQDGIGAAPMQTDKDATATDWSKLKSDAVMKAAPAAESYAIKDAADKLGKLFGKDLNRADEVMYDSLRDTFNTPEKENLEAMKKIIDALTKYKGADKEAIKKDCAQRQKDGTFTTAFAQEVAKKIGIEL